MKDWAYKVTESQNEDQILRLTSETDALRT